MIKPGDRGVHRFDRGRIGKRRPAQHDHLDSERARRRDLAIARGAAAVLGDDGIDSMQAHKRAVIRLAEWTARGHIGRACQQQGRLDRIDAADQIKVLQRVGQWVEFAAAERDKDPARPICKRAHRRADIGHFLPAIAGDCMPRRPAQGNEGHGGLPRRRAGICRNDVGIGMRGVDQRVDFLGNEIVGEARHTTKATAAQARRLRRGEFGTTGKRHDNFEFAVLGEALGQFPRFRRPAENEDA